jgi:chromosome segregation ATPase
MSRLKGNLSYCEDDLQAKETQIDRLNRERQVLREQIEELGHEITQRNQEVARAKQETFAVRMEGSDREYQDKMRHDQELFSLKSKITLLEQSIEDKDGEVRRALIELETSRNRQPTVMTMDEGEL